MKLKISQRGGKPDHTPRGPAPKTRKDKINLSLNHSLCNYTLVYLNKDSSRIGKVCKAKNVPYVWVYPNGFLRDGHHPETRMKVTRQKEKRKGVMIIGKLGSDW